VNFLQGKDYLVCGGEEDHYFGDEERQWILQTLV
jgi:hypothetical protein